jgi:uncharacterized protein YegP (UPF0339 family)
VFTLSVVCYYFEDNLFKSSRECTPGDKMPNPKFEIFKDTSGQFRFRLKAPNGEIIANSEAYTTKAACMNGIESIKTNASIAETVEL